MVLILLASQISLGRYFVSTQASLESHLVYVWRYKLPFNFSVEPRTLVSAIDPSNKVDFLAL